MRATVGLPGSGLFYTQALGHGRRLAQHQGHAAPLDPVGWLIWLGLLYVIVKAMTG